MSRLMVGLTVWIALASAASASLTPRRDSATFSRVVPAARAATLSPQALEKAAGRDTRSEFVVTDQTEITLNGAPCKYAEVPGNASIMRMELAPDRKTVRRIHFQTRK